MKTIFSYFIDVTSSEINSPYFSHSFKEVLDQKSHLNYTVSQDKLICKFPEPYNENSGVYFWIEIFKMNERLKIIPILNVLKDQVYSMLVNSFNSDHEGYYIRDHYENNDYTLISSEFEVQNDELLYSLLLLNSYISSVIEKLVKYSEVSL